MTREKRHQRPTELAGAYAIGTLRGADLTGYEQHISGCTTCAQVVADLRDGAVVLAQAVSQRPPDELRRRINGQAVAGQPPRKRWAFWRRPRPDGRRS